MNIRQLESFVAIVDRGGFGAAAEALATTQSTVSARIRELERRLGVALFDRSQHRARLTPKGEELLPFARQALLVAQQIDRRVGDPAAFAGVLRIGAVGVVAGGLLPKLLVELRRRYPNLRLKADVRLAHVLATMLEDGDIDMALITAPFAVVDVETAPIGQDSFVWAASPVLGLPAGPLTAADLARWPILSFPEESHHSANIERWFVRGGGVYAPAAVSDRMEVLADLAVAGVGVALLPRERYAGLFASGALLAVDVRPGLPPVELAAIYKRRSLLHPLVEPAAQLAAEIAGRRAGDG